MCWNERTSWITLVVGTLLNIWNIWHYKETAIVAISVMWQWVLLMQFFEAFAWRNQPQPGQKCNSTNTFAAKGAYLANVSQPIILALTILALDKGNLPRENKVTASAIILMYVLWLLYATNKAEEVECLKPGDKCGNLTYTWWQQFPGNAGMYLITLSLLVFLLLKPFKFAAMQFVYIAGTFLGSAFFYSCGIGSVWCWFAAFAPLLLGPMWKMSQS